MLNKLRVIIPSVYKRKTTIILFFLLVSMLLEALGLGLLLPIVTLILDPEIINSYPFITRFLSEYGINSHQQIISFAMLTFGLLYFVSLFGLRGVFH